MKISRDNHNYAERFNISRTPVREALSASFQAFHDALITISKMPRLATIISQLKDYLGRFRTMSLSNQTRRTQAINEHKEILQAIIEQDTEKAEQLVATHLLSARSSLLDKMKQVQV